MLSYKDMFLSLNVLESSTEKHHYCMKRGGVTTGGGGVGGSPWVAYFEGRHNFQNSHEQFQVRFRVGNRTVIFCLEQLKPI